MGVFLPNGYHRVVWTWTLDGSTKIFQVAMMGNSGTSTTANQIDTIYRAAFTAANRPFVASNMYVGFTLASTNSTRSDGGVITQLINETPVVGTLGSSLGPPINVSQLVKKNTGLIGRRYQGRLMVPQMSIPEGSITQAGIIDSAVLATQQTKWNTAVADLAAAWAGMVPVVGHSTSEVIPTPCTYVLQPKVGTMRRRIRGF